MLGYRNDSAVIHILVWRFEFTYFKFDVVKIHGWIFFVRPADKWNWWKFYIGQFCIEYFHA